MNYKSKLVFISFVLLMILPLTLFAQRRYPENPYAPDVDYGVHPSDYEKTGTTGWQFLKVNTDARTAAVGGIQSVISHGDASSLFSNPASIADVKNLSLATSQLTWLADTQFLSAGIVKNMGAIGTLGVSYVYFDYGTMERTFYTEDELGVYQPTLNQGEFSGSDLAIGLSYARNVTDRLQVGGTFRYLSETLDDGNDVSASQWAIDVGTIYYTGIKTLRVAMLSRNFGPDVEFVEYEEEIGTPAAHIPMPMSFTLGAAIDFLEGQESPHLLTVATEFIHPNDGPEKLSVGGEYTFMNLFSLRGGYRYNYDEAGLTLGGGLNLRTASFKLNINYAYIDLGRLDNKNLFSLVIGLD